MMNLKISTLNINGIRSGQRKGLLDWLAVNNPTVLCVQELRGNLIDHWPLGTPWRYFVGARAQNSAHAGVGILSKMSLFSDLTDGAMDEFKTQGRLVGTSLEAVDIKSVYAPTIIESSDIQRSEDFWNTFLLYSQQWVQRPTIVCGDLNIVGTPLDIHDSLMSFRKKSLAHQYQVYSTLIQQGWIDVWRLCHPRKVGFTCWSSRNQGMREQNRGYRLDYILCSPHLKSTIVDAQIDERIPFSDHASITAEFDLSRLNGSFARLILPR